jgi:hypothetical protein
MQGNVETWGQISNLSPCFPNGSAGKHKPSFQYFRGSAGRKIPEIFRAEKQGHLSGDRSFPFDDVGYSHGRKSNGAGKLSLRGPQFVKILFEKFTRMNRRKIVFRIHGFTSSVIINNFNIVSLTVFKPETDAPLFVYADAPLPGANSYQR